MEYLAEKKLANGVVLNCIDVSKKIVGDRWRVKMRCDATCPLENWMVEAIAASAGGEREFLQKNFAGKIVHEIFFERNFVDDGEKELVLADFVSRVNDKTAEYFSKDDFVKKLFDKRLAELKEEFLCQPIPVNDDIDSEEEGPADFSACFK